VTVSSTDHVHHLTSIQLSTARDCGTTTHVLNHQTISTLTGSCKWLQV